jgi:hypothetical protein
VNFVVVLVAAEKDDDTYCIYRATSISTTGTRTKKIEGMERRRLNRCLWTNLMFRQFSNNRGIYGTTAE